MKLDFIYSGCYECTLSLRVKAHEATKLGFSVSPKADDGKMRAEADKKGLRAYNGYFSNGSKVSDNPEDFLQTTTAKKGK